MNLPHRNDLDRIFATLLPRAREALEADGGRFYPMGASLDDGNHLHAAMVGSPQGLQPDRMMERMISDFKEQARAGRIKACGVIYDAQMEKAGLTLDAIATWLEHRDGEAAVIYVPYRRTDEGGFQYGKLMAVDAARQVW
jgi:hypothetical protein